MTIVGLDIGRGYALACPLDAFPKNIASYFKLNRAAFPKLKTDEVGIARLLSFAPTAIVLEPSGHWYSKFWATVAKRDNIEICWMGHADLFHLRGSYGFSNKRDDEDALCLAASYFDLRFVDCHGNKRYLTIDDAAIEKVRSLFYEREQLSKLRTNLIAQIKQRLSYEYPEIARKNFRISDVSNYTPILGWLAGKDNPKYDRHRERSIALVLGIEIADYTRQHASILIDLECRLAATQREMEFAISNPKFAPYLRAFERFGFGLVNKTLLLIHCYPFEKFLVGGQSWIEYELSGLKEQKRDRSLRKFQAFLGLGYTLKSSGSKTSKSFSGSTIMRTHLYAWAVCKIAPKSPRIDGEIGDALCTTYRELRSRQVKGKDALMRILFKATRLLYRELIKEIC